MALQSCNTNNHNPTVPGPLPTATPTSTCSGTPTNTATTTPTTTPVTCNTHVVFSEAASATATVNANYTYADQFTLSQASNFNAVTVVIAGASATGTGDNLKIALYSDASNYPGSVLFTSGPQALTSTGPATYIYNPPNFSLPAGNYWLAVHCSVQYEPYQNTGATTLNYLAGGNFPDPFPAGASSPGARWSYGLDTCHP